jgi:hypothetical protein
MFKIFLEDPLIELTHKFRIVLPKAIKRKMSLNNSFKTSWFDVKSKENSFTRPFDEAFSSVEVSGF